MKSSENENNNETREAKLGKRIDAVGWALFFIMIGGIGLVPKETIPEGTWLVGVGAIMLGTNLVRYKNNLKVSTFTIILGIIAIAAGLSGYYGMDLPIFSILLILVGLSIILPLFKEKE